MQYSREMAQRQISGGNSYGGASIIGPLGVIIGGIAGAAGGWWARDTAAWTPRDLSAEDEARCRTQFDLAHDAVLTYEDARVAYLVGSVAGRHPGYRDLAFEDIESDLRHGFIVRNEDRNYTYEQMRPYIREGFTRARMTLSR